MEYITKEGIIWRGQPRPKSTDENKEWDSITESYKLLQNMDGV